MKLILPLLLSLVATSALAHKDHDYGDAPVIKPQQVAPKPEAATPEADPKKATKPSEKPKAATPAAEPAPKAKGG